MNGIVGNEFDASETTMMRSILPLFFGAIFLFVAHPSLVIADDFVELTTGAKVLGRILSYEGGEIEVEVKVNGKTFTRKYPRDKVRSFSVDGSLTTISNESKSVTRSKKAIQDLISSEGEKLPEWFESTKLMLIVSFPFRIR